MLFSLTQIKCKHPHLTASNHGSAGTGLPTAAPSPLPPSEQSSPPAHSLARPPSAARAAPHGRPGRHLPRRPTAAGEEAPALTGEREAPPAAFPPPHSPRPAGSPLSARRPAGGAGRGAGTCCPGGRRRRDPARAVVCRSPGCAAILP